ncbi:hypothetical protein Hamer_G007625, partial [Homarus americanus]
KLLPIQVFLNRKDASRPNQAEIGGLSQDGGLSQGGGLGQEGGISQGGGLSQDGGLSQGGGHILNDGDTDGGQIQKDGHDQELGPSSRRKCKKPSHKLSVNYWRTKYMNNKASVKHFQSYLRAAKSTIRKQNTWKPAAAIFSNAQLRRLSNPASRSPWNQDSVAKALALSPSLPKLMSTLVEVQDETDDNTPYCTARNIGFQLFECEVDDIEYHEVQLIMSQTIDNQGCPSKESIDA